MSSSLSSLIAAVPSGRPRPLLLDHREYATAVIRQGEPIPWADLASLTGHVQQVHSLLEPDVTWIDVGALYAAHLSNDPGLLEAMGARTRTGYPLRTLLSDASGIERVVRTAVTLADATRRPLVLAVPSPAAWLVLAHALTGLPIDTVDDIAADTASMYIAEWLGKLGELPVALVVLDVRVSAIGTAAIEAEQLASYSAITNVAAHFGWTVALRRQEGVEGEGDVGGIGLVPEDFWLDGAKLPDGAALLATIPAAAEPERVLDQLAGLR